MTKMNGAFWKKKWEMGFFIELEIREGFKSPGNFYLKYYEIRIACYKLVT